MARLLRKTDDGREVYGFDATIERKAIDREQGIYEVMINVEVVDRDGDILRAAGVKLTNFRKNPVVLYAHDYRDLPVAKSLSEEIIEGKGVAARFQFPGQGISDRANEIHKMWAAEFLNAVSVGFMDLKREPLGYTDDNGEFVITGWDYLEWELYEYSIVPIPANQEALRRAIKALGIKADDDISATANDGPTPIDVDITADNEPDDELTKAEEEALAEALKLIPLQELRRLLT